MSELQVSPAEQYVVFSVGKVRRTENDKAMQIVDYFVFGSDTDGNRTCMDRQLRNPDEIRAALESLKLVKAALTAKLRQSAAYSPSGTD